MSEKEKFRRKLIRHVMKTAWKFTSDAGISIGEALVISWASVRCVIPINHTKVRGVSFGNTQLILKMLLRNRVKFFVKCEKEPYNPHHQNAVAVYVVTGFGLGSRYKIGYLSRERASTLESKALVVLKAEITGQEYLEQGGNLGVNLTFVII